jgi:hypothetical protein
MTDETVVGTPVAGENTAQTGSTDTRAETASHAETTDGSSNTGPTVEQRDGKMYIDGVRVYTRDDTNKIAASTRTTTERALLEELGVDDLDQIKNVVSELRDSDADSLSIQSLRDQVSKKEKTVEELQSELTNLRTEMVMSKHMGELTSAMPATWSADQKTAVVDLMKSRNMLQVENDTFAIRNGEEFLTDDSGERPDYAQAVQLMGKTLGLPMAKRGVDSYETDRAPESSKTQSLDESRLKSDPQYRSAYIQVREKNRGLSRDKITDAMVKKHMEGTTRGSASQRMLNTGS